MACYPRYFEIVNTTVEGSFLVGHRHALAQKQLETGYTVPRVKTYAGCATPSLIDVVLTSEFSTTKPGRCSMHLSVTVR
jgi:hypothetical protein